MSARTFSTLVCTLFLSLSANAVELKPFQQDALNKILATMDAQTQAVARPQLEQTLAMMNEAQVQLMLQKLEQPPDNPPEEAQMVEESVATPEDLEYNRAQYEPALRQAWQASHDFDEFADATLAANCPTNRDEYAVYGSAWRYEVMPMQPTWTRASNSADLEVQIVGPSYAPQDGRYDFDFSGMRNNFDRAAVESAIKSACAEYRRIGGEFMAAAKAGMQGDMLPNGPALENAANAKASPLMNALGDKLKSLGPAGNAPILTALINGTRVE
jgi:hypothetical protein